MTFAEAVAASVVLTLSCSSAAQLWSQGLRAGSNLAQRAASLERLESLLVASEGKARQVAQQLASTSGPPLDCQAAAAQLVVQLQALPLAQLPYPAATLTLPPTSAASLIHLRWQADGLQRERLLSLTALGLCNEGDNGTGTGTGTGNGNGNGT